MLLLIAWLIETVVDWLFPQDSELIDRLTDDTDRDPVDDEFALVAAAVLWPASIITTLPLEA